MSMLLDCNAFDRNTVTDIAFSSKARETMKSLSPNALISILALEAAVKSGPTEIVPMKA